MERNTVDLRHAPTITSFQSPRSFDKSLHLIGFVLSLQMGRLAWTILINIPENWTSLNKFRAMLQLISFPIFFLSVIVLFNLARYWRMSRVSIRHKLPPGPPKLPLIGNLYCFLGGSLPHHSLTDLAKKYGSVMHLQLGERFAVVLSSTEAVKEALKTKDISFAQRPEFLSVEIIAPGQSSIAFAPYGDYWRRVRKISVNELLSAKRVQSYRSIREEEVWDMVESVSSLEGAAVNLSDTIFAMTNNVTSRAAFGLKCKDQAEFLSLLEELVRMGSTLPDLFPSLRFLRYITGIQPALKTIHKKLDRILEGIVNEHKGRLGKQASSDDEQDGNEDILDVLLKIQDSDKFDINLTNERIKSVVMDMYSAGSETSATTME